MFDPGWPEFDGHYASYGGQYVSASAAATLKAVEEAWRGLRASNAFWTELLAQLSCAGRPTALEPATALAKAVDLPLRIVLKREDRLQTGSSAITHCLGQAQVARHLGRARAVCESGSGLHGIAAVTACAALQLPCTVFMGTDDMARQPHSVARIEELGGRIEPSGRTLYDAAAAALDAMSDETFYVARAGMGPHPYPSMTRDLGSILGVEMRRQLGVRPDAIIATLNDAPAAFHAFLRDERVRLIAVEAGGGDVDSEGENAAVFTHGHEAIMLGTKSRVLVDADGHARPTRSMAAGLDLSVGPPELAFLHAIQRVEVDAVPDEQALMAWRLMAQSEGISLSIEAAHAVAAALRVAPSLDEDALVAVVIGGSGEKDVARLTAS